MIKAVDVKKVLAENILADGLDPIMDLKNSHGSWIVDGRDGKEYLDMFSMYASGSVGYNHPRILNIQDSLGSAAIHKPTLSDIYNTSYADFVKTFNSIAVPDYLKHTFFIEGGALAVENALKAAFDWKYRKNLELNINASDDMKVIHFNQAFHGRSGYTLSLTNTTDPRKTMYFPKFEWPRVTNPKLTFPNTDSSLENVMLQEQKALNEIKDSLMKNPNKIAALILEPIQGEGGDNHFRDEFFIELRNICDEDDILFILDEVQTGIGITGKMWAHEYNSVNPDIISFGKKSQVCGFLAGNRILEVENNVFRESSRINSTFGGSLVDMVRFQEILNIIIEENLINNANIMGNYLLEKIRFLAKEFPGFITNARGLGLFCAFDLPSGIERDGLLEEIMKFNLLILGSGDESIRFRPHLNVCQEEIDSAIDIITKSIRNCLK